MKILLAEDEEAVRRILLAQLAQLGYEVFAAADGEEAWKLYCELRPDAVLADWSMPVIDGLELCRRIRAEHGPRYVYLIVVTAFDKRVGFLESMAAGADDFISKPCDPMELDVRLRVGGRILALQNHVARLEGLLPICPSCKKIRDEASEWQQVESYISRRSEAQFSHGICPECYESVMRPQVEELKRGLQKP